MTGRSLGYGALLTLAMLALAVIGAGIVIVLGRNRTAGARPALFLWVLVGQVGLMVYVYARSLIASVLPLPVTEVEILLIAGAALIYVGMRTNTFGRMFASPRAIRWTLIQLSTLAAISIWIADRELPRLVMLSSDPEIHAFFARQVERMGAVPRNAEGWGDGAFHYPAGSAVLTYVWTSLSGLDVRNALAALPLMQCALAALVIVEVVSAFARGIAVRSVLVVAVLGVTFAGFLFPLYEQYSHMEGVARQVSGGAFALSSVLLLAHRRLGITSEWMTALLLAATVFCLGVLNPVNVMIPSSLAAAFVVCCAVQQRRVSPVVLAPPIAALLLLLDPYYVSLILGDSSGTAKVELAPHLKSMSFDEVMSAWVVSIKNAGEFLRLLVTFPAANPLPSFIVMLASVGVLLIATATCFKRVATGGIFTASLIVILWLMFGVFAALRGDARFYLLAPYFEFSLIQHKALLLVLMSGLVVALVHAKYRQLTRTSLVAAAIVLLIAAVVRPVQQLRLEPRFSYCGSMGCSTPSDLEVIRKFLSDARFREPSQQGRILVPNSINQMGPEKWLFPVGGARLLAQESDVPLAFYYYQGDDDYTTENYVSHVCNALDRAWLRSEHIRYVFLPADRSTACVASMEALRTTERVVASSGNSYLLELR